MVKDKYGYISKGGYLGQSRISRLRRNKTMSRKLKWDDNNPNNDIVIPDEPISNKITIPVYLTCLFIGILTILRRLNIL